MVHGSLKFCNSFTFDVFYAMIISVRLTDVVNQSFGRCRWLLKLRKHSWLVLTYELVVPPTLNTTKDRKRTMFTSISTSIQLNAHGDITAPRPGVNTQKSRPDWWNYLERHCMIDVIISTENLKYDKGVILENMFFNL